MANLNRIILVGTLVNEPEGRSTMDGLPMTKFKLSVARPFGGADLIDVVAWRKVAEDCADRLKKGKMVLVEGRIQIRAFEDQSGQRRWTTEVVARGVQMFDQAQAAGFKPQAESGQASQDGFAEDIDLASDLPF